MKGGQPKNLTRAGKGRPKGSQNKSTRDIRTALALIAQNNIEAFSEWLLGIRDPGKRCDIFLRLLEFNTPKLTKGETDINVKHSLQDFTDEELRILASGAQELTGLPERLN